MQQNKLFEVYVMQIMTWEHHFQFNKMYFNIPYNTFSGGVIGKGVIIKKYYANYIICSLMYILEYYVYVKMILQNATRLQLNQKKQYHPGVKFHFC